MKNFIIKYIYKNNKAFFTLIGLLIGSVIGYFMGQLHLEHTYIISIPSSIIVLAYLDINGGLDL